MIKASLYWIANAPNTWRLAILPRPRGGEWLDDEIASLALQGVSVLVSLLTTAEVNELDLTAEPAACVTSSVRFVSFPIEDRSIPTDTGAVHALIHKIRNALDAGQGVAIHCRAGLGRSAMIAAATLVTANIQVDHAFRLIAAARRCQVPDTQQQRDWVNQYQNRL